MKKLLLAVILFLAIAFAFTSLAEIEKVAAVMVTGKWQFLTAALILQICWLGIVGATYSSLYRIVGIPDTTRRLWKLASAAQFANVIAPTGGVSAAAVFLSDANRNQKSTARVTVIYTLSVFFEYIGFLFILILGLGILASGHSIHAAEIAASILLVLAATALAVILYLAMVSEALLGRFLSGCSRLINSIVRPIIQQDWLHEKRALSFSRELAEGVSDLKRHPNGLLAPLGLALTNKALLILILWLIAMAFETYLRPDILIAGFSIGYLFLIVSPTPAGVGVMESAMALSLRSLGVTLETATVITIAFRGITFWIPLVIGAINFKMCQSNFTGSAETV
ncbi:MAG: flippase-like domain-containing protein [Leptolinea sp.]|nr:flippase-like domain-containing protein [Leptolinea sp.]